MIDELLNHIKKYTELDAATTAQIAKSFIMTKAKKRMLLQREGELCPQIFFVAKGCLRMFYLDEKGTEHTIQFALENWWMTDLEAFNKKGTSAFSIQAVEDAVVLSVSKDELTMVLQKHPGLEKYFRSIYERAYSASLVRLTFFRLPKEEFYATFCAKYPAFIQRIPQKYLASFLGFTPEYLSELRKKNTALKL